MDRFVEGKVSIIIPVYNAERYLEEALNSVYLQTYRNIEIVLVNDCSTDNSSALIENLMVNHSNIIYFEHEKNLGAGEARNKALELATGQYVAFLDADDIWLPNKIESQLAYMKMYNVAFCYTAIEMIDEFGKKIKSKRNVKEKCDYSYLLHNTIIATSSVVLDRRMLGDIRMSSRRGGQDYSTWLMILRDGTIAYGIDEALIKYRIRNDSLSSNKYKSINQIWQIQTKDEKIPKIQVVINLIRFSFNAIRKYYF